MIDKSDNDYVIKTDDYEDVIVKTDKEFIEYMTFFIKERKYRILLRGNFSDKKIIKELFNLGYTNIESINEKTYDIIKELF